MKSRPRARAASGAKWRGDARGQGRGRGRSLRLPAAVRPAGSMLSPKIRQARRGECAFPCALRCGEGDQLPARGNLPALAESLQRCPRSAPGAPPELQWPPHGRARLLPPGRARLLPGRAAGGNGACRALHSGRMKRRRSGPMLVLTNVVCNIRAEQQG